MTTPALLFLAAFTALFFVVLPPRPQPVTRRHRVIFRHTIGLIGWLVRFLPYEARQITRADMQRKLQALTRGVDPRDATDDLVRAVFVRRWWHVGPLAPEQQFRLLKLEVIPDYLQLLMHPPTATPMQTPTASGG